MCIRDSDMPVAAGEEVALLINGLGATSAEELYLSLIHI